MIEVLRAAGGSYARRAEDADLVVFNTCSVRDKAEQKLRSEVGKLVPLKRARPELVIAIAGCVAQQEGMALLKHLPHVNLVIGPDNVAELPALLAAQFAGAPPAARTEFDVVAPRFLTWAQTGTVPSAPSPAVAFVTTMKGCDERCTFCIVPYTRGPERYRSAQEIVDEVRSLVARGTREVVLLGQTVDSFRDPTLPEPAHRIASDSSLSEGDETQFPDLLRMLAGSVPAYDVMRRDAPGLARIRYTSPHPRHATASLARAHAELDLLAHHVHLPVQSGSDRILRRMGRRYTWAEYVARAERLMRARTDLTLSTDIIVGFPGETEEDFELTLALVKRVGFTSVFGFKYSPRPYTPALLLGDDVSEAEKSRRLERLFELADGLSQAHLSRLVGTRQRVLVEGPSKSERASLASERVQGRTERNEIVHLSHRGAAALVGSIVDVTVVRANKHSLLGALEGAPRPEGAGRRHLPVLVS
jgi:tRNA-2-methylthio-N6-dimethylallyladenosine synthase